MSNRKSLLFLTTDLPFPADSGGRIKTFRLLEFLAKEYDVRVLCARGGSKKQLMENLKTTLGLTSVQAFTISKKRGVLNWLVALLNFSTFNAFRVYSKELETMVKWSLESSDIIIVDHLEMIDLIPERHRAMVVYHSHNAEFKIWDDFANLNSSIFTKWAMKLEAGRVKRLERYAINSTSFTFASPNDQKVLASALRVDPEKFRNTYHLGNDELLTMPELNLDKKPTIFYAGTLDWEPNRDGLKWFLNECWPLIKAKQPEITFQICGRGAHPDLIALMTRCKGVDYLGFVDDLNEVMEKATLTVVPLRFGSGMKIKTLDAMYRGLPLVTTSVGAEGIELINERHAMIADTSSAFAEAVYRLATETPLRWSLSRESRKLAASQYTYASLAKSMTEDLNNLIQ